MGNRKVKIFWFLNAILFAVIVFMGINQAGKGAEIVDYEKRYRDLEKESTGYEEKIFNLTSFEVTDKLSQDLGYSKPESFLYIDNPETFASLLSR